jgi:hypothetical protein
MGAWRRRQTIYCGIELYQPEIFEVFAVRQSVEEERKGDVKEASRGVKLGGGCKWEWGDSGLEATIFPILDPKVQSTQSRTFFVYVENDLFRSGT